MVEKSGLSNRTLACRAEERRPNGPDEAPMPFRVLIRRRTGVDPLFLNKRIFLSDLLPCSVAEALGRRGAARGGGRRPFRRREAPGRFYARILAVGIPLPRRRGAVRPRLQCTDPGRGSKGPDTGRPGAKATSRRGGLPRGRGPERMHGQGGVTAIHRSKLSPFQPSGRRRGAATSGPLISAARRTDALQFDTARNLCRLHVLK
jgi:hypothetical protein